VNCLESDTEYKEAYFKLAYLNILEGNYNDAEKMALQYYKRDSSYVYNLINLGEIEFHLAKIKDAEFYYKKAVQFHPVT